jgi:FkbM family methyltransferase
MSLPQIIDPPLEIIKNNSHFKICRTCREGPEWWLTNYSAWESHTFDFFDKLLHKDMTYLDIGTFSGHTVLYAASKVKEVFGIDLDPLSFQACFENVKCNEFSNVTIEHLGISGQDAQLFIEPSLVGTSGCRIIPDASPNGAFKVDTLTADSLMKRWKLDKCDFIKMDIEGGEELCLPTMGSFFERYKPLLYLSVHKHLGATAQTVVESTKDFNYVYNKSFTNVKDTLYEQIEAHSHHHGEQDYLFSYEPLDHIFQA